MLENWPLPAVPEPKPGATCVSPGKLFPRLLLAWLLPSLESTALGFASKTARALGCKPVPAGGKAQ